MGLPASPSPKCARVTESNANVTPETNNLNKQQQMDGIRNVHTSTTNKRHKKNIKIKRQ